MSLYKCSKNLPTWKPHTRRRRTQRRFVITRRHFRPFTSLSADAVRDAIRETPPRASLTLILGMFSVTGILGNNN
ncbi:hypothetical protein C8R44DRAFT_860289 [Mycena epipterygia]|nr:hypothetical protein C8R44DRAFT_860289 [Mycena epipterygia]